MGNVVQCCYTLSHYFRCKDTSAPSGTERSPLLSSEGSECDSPTLPDDLEDDLLTISTGITNPALEPEHFLFPDLILSSNLGGDMALVEPMVCLLVSEEEEGAGGEGRRADEPGGAGGQDRAETWRSRGFSEVETQTEVEMQIVMGVQTQTQSQAEVQTQTERLVFNNEAAERETQSNSDFAEDTEAWKDPERLTLASQTLSEKDLDVTKMRSNGENRELYPTCCGEVFEELQVPVKEDEEAEQDILKEEQICNSLTKHLFQKENNCLQQELNVDKENAFSLQQDTFHAQGNKDHSVENVMEGDEHSVNHMGEKMFTPEPDGREEKRDFQVSKHSSESEGVQDFGPNECCEDLTKDQDNETEKRTAVSAQIVNNYLRTNTTRNQYVDHRDEAAASPQQTDDHTRRSCDQAQGNTDKSADHTDTLENIYPSKNGNNETTVQCVLDLEAAFLQEDDTEPEPKQITLFLVDRLFLEAPHVKAPPHQTEENSQDTSQEKSGAADEIKQLCIRDIVDHQETGFSVKIQAPGTDSFELQVSGPMLVAELQQVLMDHEVTCHRTCFSLQVGGATLDALMELRSIRGIQDGAVIKVVEGSYSVRDARLHLRHVRDLLRSLDPTDAYDGVNGSSLSYLSFFTQGDKEGESLGKRRVFEQESVDCSPPEYILPGCKDRLLTPLQPVRDDWKPLQCLRVLTMSSWNPPPGNRKMHGDLMYLSVLTIEDKELNITSSTRGFYINQSTAFNFNPKPALPRMLCHSLVELLSQVSPAFKKNYSTLQKKRVEQHPYERIATPFQMFTWTAPQGDHVLDGVRAEETHTSRMGQDEHTAGQSRDWNEELQASRELPKDLLQERLHRERSIFKTNSDFVGAATRGAVAVVDGNIMALNPGEAPHSQMFIWNNIFFSQGFDVSEHYSPLGGNAAAHAAAVCDLRGAQAYASVDIQGLHTLGTTVIDYRGIRVVAQTIVPGLLEKSQEQSVVYGSNDYGETVYTHPRFLEPLDKSCRPLRIQRHQVLDHNNSPVDLCSSIETKGILGNDGRPYILDLLRTSPPDLNFQMSETEKGEEEEKVPKDCQRFGFPRRSRHRLASLRPELIDAFVQHRYEQYINIVSKELRALEEFPDNQQMEAETTEDECTGQSDYDSRRRAVIMEACKTVGSVSDSCFDIRFNPDVCAPGVRFPPECAEQVQRQKQLLWDAATFLLSNQIPAVLRDCLDYTAVPMDGLTLTSALHQHGVNVRYLGMLLDELDKIEDKRRLGHVQRISISEIIVRSAKHIFTSYLQDVEAAAFSAAVSHFLNCLLSSTSSCFSESCANELLTRRRSRRRRSHGSRAAVLTETVWARLTPTELWSRIRAEAEDYYHYTIQSTSIDEVIETHNLQRISLLREISTKTGIQVQLRDYVFESRHKPAFVEDDIVNMFPVVKHLKPTATDASRLVQQAQVAVQRGLLKDGYEMISQAMTLFSSICGVLHEDVSMCLRLLGRLSYILGNYADAISHQEKTVMSSERVQGIDHPQTIQDYTHLALYCFAGGRQSTSLQLLYRARYLTLLVCGEDHPQVGLLDSMLGLVLHGLMEYKLSHRFLQNALILTSKYHGATSLKHAHSHHLLATMLESKGEFRSALQHEKEAFSIYKSQVGENHDKTMESSEYLKSLTQQAVMLQKAINQIYSSTPGACVPPPKFTSPNLAMILQQLNLTCGIILIPLSAKDVADLRTEFKAKEKVQVAELEKQLLKKKHSTSADDWQQQ